MRTRGWQGNLPSDSEEARTRILNAAIASVEKHGVNKTTLADVANELGVTRQTVYRYFSSVNDMLAAVAQAGAADFLDGMRRDLAHVTTVDGAIVETILYCLNRLPDEPSMGLLLRAGQTELFTREATSESGISLGAQMLGRGDGEDEIACGEAGQVGDGLDPRLQRDAWEEHSVFVAFVDRFHDLGFARLQGDLETRASADLRQSCAPGAGADHAHMLECHALAPLRP